MVLTEQLRKILSDHEDALVRYQEYREELRDESMNFLRRLLGPAARREPPGPYMIHNHTVLLLEELVNQLREDDAVRHQFLMDRKDYMIALLQARIKELENGR